MANDNGDLKRAVKERSVEQRLFNADDTLHTAMHGLELLQPHEVSTEAPDALEALPLILVGDKPGLPDEEKFQIGRRLHMGLRIATTFNVATTLAVQTLRGHADGFDDWWKPRRKQLVEDPLAAYLWAMRVDVAHSGTTGIYQLMTQGTFGAEATWSVWLAFPREFDDENRAHVLIEAHLARIGVILSDAWAEFSPETKSMGPR